MSAKIEAIGGMSEMHKGSLCRLLPWDTEFFGCRIASICGDSLNEEQALQIDVWSRSHHIQCLYFLARMDDPATIQTAGKHGFGLADIRVTLDYVMHNSNQPARPDASAGINIRPFQADDLVGLQSMARTGHTDTRFFKDSHFSREHAEELYSTWIARDTEGRAQIVWVAASMANEPLGYISCHVDSARQEGRIGLVGVSSQARRRGIGKSLVLTALGWFKTQGVNKVMVVTQGNNLAAQRLYQQCGFLSRDLQIWYHKWYPTVD